MPDRLKFAAFLLADVIIYQSVTLEPLCFKTLINN
jgi:hypothetical protein